MSQQPSLPAEQALIQELLVVRDGGLPSLRHLTLDALVHAARLVSLDEDSVDHVVVEALLRRAVARLGGGQFGAAAVALLGIDSGTRGLNSKLRREIAAEAFDRTYETFRKNYEPLVFEQLATQILILCSEQHTRGARRARERAASPELTDMPPVWMERFASYYRIWSTVSGLGADLTAYRSTLIEPPAIWDRRFGTNAPDDPGYSQEEQAEGYATFALFHYAHFEWELKQFQTLFGGQWLLSEAEAEEQVADAVYRIWWHSPWNERDKSYLRTLVAQAREQELHFFIELLRSTDLGRTIEREWHEWAASCACVWPLALLGASVRFPTFDHHKSISAACVVHNVIRACGSYLDLIDADWSRLADWYHTDKSLLSADRKNDQSDAE